MNKKPCNQFGLHSAFSLIELSIVILVIGIIVAGITQSSRLIEQFKITSARSLTKSSPVSSVKGLSLWLETTSQNSFLDGEDKDLRKITKWLDINTQSVTKAHATPSGVVKYKAACINNLPCLNLAAGGVLTIDASAFPKSQEAPPIVDNFTVFVVAQKTIAGPVFDSTNSGANSVGFKIKDTSIEITKAGTDSGAVTPASSVGLTKPVIIQLDVKQDGTALFYLNGGASASASSSFGSSLSPTGVIGGGSFTGNLGEVIVYSRVISRDERSSIAEYLKKKWGIK